jgi:sRNA-binding regulator protein Hfq
MAFSRRRHFKKRHTERFRQSQVTDELVHPEHTGSESAFLKSLVDSHAKVTVVLKNGEKFRGHIRYYDRHCFSLGLSAKGPRLFLRKASVSYIAEE